jgi:ComF family protein
MRRFRLHGLRYANDYTGALRSTIHKFKYKGQRRLAGPLGTVLAATFRQHQLQVDALVPLPLHIQRERARGYNQAVLLARECAASLRIPCLENVVWRQRDTLAQVGLTSQERLQNMAGAFALRSDTSLTGLRKLLLVDDVCTTGATLESCAVPLYAAGVREIWGLVLARPLSPTWKD